MRRVKSRTIRAYQYKSVCTVSTRTCTVNEDHLGPAHGFLFRTLSILSTWLDSRSVYEM